MPSYCRSRTAYLSYWTSAPFAPHFARASTGENGRASARVRVCEGVHRCVETRRTAGEPRLPISAAERASLTMPPHARARAWDV
jgi:hypothetical protein